MTRIYIENQELELTADIQHSITYSIDDLVNLDSKSSAFTKTIVIPGTNRNNQLFGNIFELSHANDVGGATNVFYDFDASRSAVARIEINGLQAMRGVLRLLSITVDKGRVDYEVALFGELSGFINSVGVSKIEELDFSSYNHQWNFGNITNTFSNIDILAFSATYQILGPLGTELYDTVYEIRIDGVNGAVLQAGDRFIMTGTTDNDGTYEAVEVYYGEGIDQTVIHVFDVLIPESGSTLNIVVDEKNGYGYVYPLIDYGMVKVSDNGFTDNLDWSFKTFRPALYVKEYLDKIIRGAGYSYESEFMSTPFFKSLIVPNNDIGLEKRGETFYVEADDDAIDVDLFQANNGSYAFEFANTPTLTDFNYSGGLFRYTGTSSINVKVKAKVDLYVLLPGAASLTFSIAVNGNPIITSANLNTTGSGFQSRVTFELEGLAALNNGDAVELRYTHNHPFNYATPTRIDSGGFTTTLKIEQDPAGWIQYNYDELLELNQFIPRNVYQKDFFISILKMFNLMVQEVKGRDRHFKIEPYIDFYQRTNFLDWSGKVNRDKPAIIKPMSEANARLYEFKYKEDKDYYNELYKSRFNQVYGNRTFDNQLEFSKDKSEVNVIFSPSVLVGFDGEDKIFPAIYKYEESTGVKTPIAHNIRIMQTKLIEDVAEFNIVNGDESLGTSTTYIYAGHLNDPAVPSIDINWGATNQLYFEYNGDGSLQGNLFNAFYSPYLAEITDKDSRLLTVEMRLNEIDIFQLDFSRLIYLDGVVFRLMKIRDWTTQNVCKVDMLRVINTEYPVVYPSFADGFVMKFADMGDVDTMLTGSRLSVADWNTFFGLTGGNVFSNVFQEGNYIVLTGKPSFKIAEDRFLNNTNIIGLWDYSGCIEEVLDDAFNGSSIYIFQSKSALKILQGGFQNCAVLYEVKVPLLEGLDPEVFKDSANLKYIFLPSMFSCGGTASNEDVFPLVTGKNIYLTISEFMYNLNDADITDLIDNNNVNLTIVP
jgi:hypothetical protein